MAISILSYLLKSIFCMGVFYLLYKIALSKLTHFQWSRFYLLGIVALSMIIPAIQIPISLTGIEQESALYEVALVSNNLESELMAPTSSPSEAQISPEGLSNIRSNGVQWGDLFLTVYVLGLLYFSFKFFQSVWLVMNLIRTNPSVLKGGYYHVKNHTNVPTFSFFNYIFLNTKNEKLSETELEKVLCHEAVHVKQYHSLDILILEIYKIFFWFNPLVKYLRESLSEVHEFLADSETLGAQSDDDESGDYSRLIVKLASRSRTLNLTSSFSKIDIRKRLLMLKRVRSANSQKLRFVLALPILLIMLTAFSLQKQGESWSEKHTVLDYSGEVIRYLINEFSNEKDIIKSSWYHKDGELLYFTIYDYKDGKCLKDSLFHGDSATSGKYAGQATGKYTLYTYRDTLVIKWAGYTEGGTVVSSAHYEYNETNYLSKEIGHDAAAGYRLYEYDELNRISQRKTYDNDNSLTYFEEYEYRGKYLIQRVKYKASGDLVETHTFEKL